MQPVTRVGVVASGLLRLLGVVGLASSLLGCAGVVVGGFGEGSLWHRAPEPVRAQNPLGGGALEGGAKPRDPDLVRANAAHCRPWPLRDAVHVEVKGGLVCVREEVHILSYESGSLPVPTLPAELSTNTGGTRKVSLQAQGELSKVGVCGGLDPMRTAVWAREYAACVPNDGLVDDRTESLGLSKPGTLLSTGYETIRWTFPARSTAPAKSAPTAKSSRR